jgi:phosphoribosyl 1,2-cyclic phosphodiesterase
VRLVPLGSGSKGNATLVEFESTRLLVDAGLSARQLSLRLEAVGVSPNRIDCVLLSHEHGDHCRGARRFSNCNQVPVACSIETLEAMDLSPVNLFEWVPLLPSQSLDLGSVRVDSFPVPHDAARPVGFVLHGDGVRVGFATDLGHATTLVRERLAGCEALVIESNHDEAMLRDGPYPWHLKQRVSGRMGHLSNHETAALLRGTVDGSCRAVVLAHLSERNNTHALARRTAAMALQAAGAKRVEMRIAEVDAPSPPVCL